MPNKRIRKDGGGDKSAILEAKLTKLRRENRKLRTAIDRIWNVAEGVDSGDSDAAFDALNATFGLISTALPGRYIFADEALPSDASQDAAILFQQADDQQLTRDVAAEMGLTVEQFSLSEDVDAKLMALRRVFFRLLQLDKDPALGLTDEDYLHLVAGNFTAAVGLAARFPLSLKKEAIRYIKALEKIRNKLDKGKREPANDVKVALEMIEKEGYRFKDRDSMESICQSAITIQNGCSDNYSEMLPAAKRLACRDLQKRIDSLFRGRKTRAYEAAGNQLVESGDTLDDPKFVDTLCLSTVTVHNGYDQNYSSMSKTDKRSAARAFCKEVALRLRERRSAQVPK